MFKEVRMFGTLKTLIQGQNARAEERLRAAHAVELIDQKLREAGQGVKLAKLTLASLIQRQRAETRQLADLDQRLADMTQAATQALQAGHEDLAAQAAGAIASMENERALRVETSTRLQSSVQTSTRRLIDLKQGAIAARALRDEQALQSRLNSTLSGPSPMAEAEELINQVMGRDDPLEQSEILAEIDRDLAHETLADHLSDKGFGPVQKSTPAAVLARLKSQL
jgi:phage shock protein A